MTTQMEIGPAEVRTKKRRRRVGTLADFLHEVKAWGLANAARLARMHCFVKGGVYHMYIVPKTVPYDLELTRSHSRFTIALWDEYRISAVGSQIPDGPPEELSVYFDPTDAFTLTPM